MVMLTRKILRQREAMRLDSYARQPIVESSDSESSDMSMSIGSEVTEILPEAAFFNAALSSRLRAQAIHRALFSPFAAPATNPQDIVITLDDPRHRSVIDYSRGFGAANYEGDDEYEDTEVVSCCESEVPSTAPVTMLPVLDQVIEVSDSDGSDPSSQQLPALPALGIDNTPDGPSDTSSGPPPLVNDSSSDGPPPLAYSSETSSDGPPALVSDSSSGGDHVVRPTVVAPQGRFHENLMLRPLQPIDHVHDFFAGACNFHEEDDPYAPTAIYDLYQASVTSTVHSRLRRARRSPRPRILGDAEDVD